MVRVWARYSDRAKAGSAEACAVETARKTKLETEHWKEILRGAYFMWPSAHDPSLSAQLYFQGEARNASDSLFRPGIASENMRSELPSPLHVQIRFGSTPTTGAGSSSTESHRGQATSGTARERQPGQPQRRLHEEIGARKGR
jgi:hypothetical protein